MTKENRLLVLKKDLQMTTTANDEYLETLLDFSVAAIEREGIILSGDSWAK